MVAKSKKPYSRAPAPKKSELLFQVGKEVPKWYSVEKPSISPSSTSHNAYEKYDKDKCEQIYRSECELYRKFYQQDQSSDYQWLQTSLSTTAKVKDGHPKATDSNLRVYLGSSCGVGCLDSSFTCSRDERTRESSQSSSDQYSTSSWSIDRGRSSRRCFRQYVSSR